MYLFWYRDQLTEYAIDSMFEGSMKYQSNKEHKRIQEHPTKSDKLSFFLFFFHNRRGLWHSFLRCVGRRPGGSDLVSGLL